MENHLLYFFGKECLASHEMNPIIDQLELESGMQIDRLEVWHDEQNSDIFHRIDTTRSFSTPFFINLKTGRWACGVISHDTLRSIMLD